MKKKFLTFSSAASFLAILVSFFAAYSSDAFAATSGEGWDISSVQAYNLPDAPISAIIEGILNWLLSIFGIVGVIGFLISGVMYLLSAGDDDMAKKAKNGMKFSIYGIIVGLAGLVVIQAVDALLAGSEFF